MNYEDLIKKAIEKGEVLQLLRGAYGYEVAVSEFAPDIFPTDINTVLVRCFYEQKKKIDNIENIFEGALKQLLLGSASDVYVAVLYFDACIFQEERKRATFKLDKEDIIDRIKQALYEKKNELQECVVFSNGMEKQKPWKNIENLNRYYYKKYKMDFITF